MRALAITDRWGADSLTLSAEHPDIRRAMMRRRMRNRQRTCRG
jgi:hypothetical protein